MIVAVDLGQVAELAFTMAGQHPPRSAERRAASHLWVSLTIPAAASVDAAMRAIDSFGDHATRQAAAELMHRLAAQLRGTPA